MTKLEEEIFIAQGKVWYSSNPTDYAKAAAEVAKKYIVKAWSAAYASGRFNGNAINKAIARNEGIDVHVPTLDKWLKENGIIE